MTAVVTGPVGAQRAPGHVDFVELQRALAGQFTLERELGRGGMGVVFLAREVELDRPVAVKVLPPALAAHADVRERFLREARTAARLSHPNIVPVYRVEEAGGFVFLVMGYVDGPTLEGRVRRRGALPPADVARIVRDVAWALAYAHARGIVHRDVKPENILLDRETGRAVVTDFGIAQVAGALAGAPPGRVLGTAHFMSPEQAAGRPVDGRSDLYSLGVVAFYALTGRLPFEGPPEAVVAKHLAEAPPPLSALNPAVPPALAAAVQRAMAKSPDDRYPSAEAFAEAVALALARSARLPTLVRVWLAGGDEVRYVVAAALGLTGLAVAQGGLWAELAAFVMSAALAWGLLELSAVRPLLAAGYRLGDLRMALGECLAERAWAGAGAHGVRRTALEEAIGARRRTLARVLGLVVAGAAAVVGAVRALRHALPAEAVGMAIVALGGLALALGPGRSERAGRPSILRVWLWRGPVGGVLARLAGWRVRPSGHAGDAAPTPLPAETLIGRATQELYAALPPAARRELRALPDAVRRLEHDATALRRRLDELTRVLAALEGDGGVEPAAEADADAVAARRTAATQAARTARDAAGRQLADVVTTLEHIRIELLRLQADAGDVRRLVAVLDDVVPPASPAAPSTLAAGMPIMG